MKHKLNLARNNENKFGMLKNIMNEIDSLLKTQHINLDDWEKHVNSQKKLFFELAKQLIGKTKLDNIIMKENDVKRHNNKIEYASLQYNVLASVFAHIQRSFKNTIIQKTNENIADAIQQTTYDVKKEVEIKKIIPKKIEIKKIEATYGDMAKALGLSYILDQDNFERVFKTIDQRSIKNLKIMRRNLNVLKSGKKDTKSIDAYIEILIDYIERTIKECTQKIDKGNELKEIQIQKKKLMIEQKQKQIDLQEATDINIEIFENILISFEKEYKKNKNNLEYIKSWVLTQLDTIHINVINKFQNKSEFANILNDFSRVVEIYKEIEGNRMQIAIEHGYYLGDILNFLIKLEDKHTIRLEVPRDLKKLLKKYKNN